VGRIDHRWVHRQRVEQRRQGADRLERRSAHVHLCRLRLLLLMLLLLRRRRHRVRRGRQWLKRVEMHE